MERNFETVMIEQCAPVLAGLKPANLFRHESRDRAAFYATAAAWDARLAPKGIRLRVLKECAHGHWYLVYLYRPARLGAALASPDVAAFLRREGYALPPDPAAPAGCAALRDPLSGRLCCEGEFPHEIGLFLGYPLCDVRGFIEDARGGVCLGCGYWKVYGEVEEREKLFKRYERCSRCICEKMDCGTPLEVIFKLG